VLKELSLPRMRLALEAGSQGIMTDALILDGYLYAALQAVLRGERFLDPALGTLIETGVAGDDPRLNVKQLQILKRLVMGDNDRDIAINLCMPIDTVKYNVKQIYRAFGVSTRSSAALLAVRLGLASFPPLPLQPLSPTVVQNLLREFKAESPS
jgi:DNA-binding NarL/FixJ family response regulator